MEELKTKLENKKILILGFAREGKSTLEFLKRFFPNLKVSIADQKDSENYLDNLKDFELIIKSPGIPWKLKEIKEAKEAGVEFTSQTQIFLDLFRDQTIGITGTKGKSTTASLIFNILKISGENVCLVGNIGKPVLDFLEGLDDKRIFVYEMSSHQLSDVATSPHIGVFLNIFPEHLDYYSSFEEYLHAKENITRFQNENDLFVYSSDFEEIKNIANSTKAKKQSFTSEGSLEKYDIEISKNPLLGKHNLNNIKAAILVTRFLGIDNLRIKEGIESFEPLEDRLQLIRTVNDITFIDDSLSTIPQSTIAALNAFEEKVTTLILGGFDRNIDFEILGHDLEKRKNVSNIVLIGQTTNKIQEVLISNNYSGKIHNLGIVPMKEIVEIAYKLTPKGGVVLLSPAATSFDMFKDYKDRADQFKDSVDNLI